MEPCVQARSLHLPLLSICRVLLGPRPWSLTPITHLYVLHLIPILQIRHWGFNDPCKHALCSYLWGVCGPYTCLQTCAPNWNLSVTEEPCPRYKEDSQRQRGYRASWLIQGSGIGIVLRSKDRIVGLSGWDRASTYLFDVCSRGKWSQTWGWITTGLCPSTLREGNLAPSIIVILPKAQLPEPSCNGLITWGASEEKNKWTSGYDPQHSVETID